MAPLDANGEKKIPLVGFGTAEYPFASSQSAKHCILQAIRTGYRHFDTASVYQSEVPLGEAVAEALRLGLIKSRSELFITSKLWIRDAQCELVIPALQKSLQNLGMEYLDLYLIHFPVGLKAGTALNFKKEDIIEMDLESVWEAREGCQNLGLTRSIGVSNFTRKKLERLLANARTPPAVNQVEMHPVWQQKKLRQFCDEKGIHITAYSPLGAKGTPWGHSGGMDSEVLKEIANARGKTVAQICLKWVSEQGVSLVVKSFNEERMKQNLDIFDWKLSEEELKRIDEIPQHRGALAEYYISQEGPYKSIEELWDGEI